MITHNLLLLITGLLGFVTAGLTFKNYKLNTIMNCYIIIIIFIISARYFSLGLIQLTSQNSVIAFYLKYSNLSLIVAPLFFLYFKKLADCNPKFLKKELLHFIFPICFFVFSSNIEVFKMNYKGFPFVLNTIVSLYLLLYTILTYRILKEKNWISKERTKVINKQNILNSKWASFLFLGTIVIEARLIGSLFFESHYGIIVRGFRFGWFSALIWLIILIKILSSPEILYGYKILNEKVQENRTSNLKFDKIWQLQAVTEINNVQHLALKEKIDKNLQNYFEEIEKKTLEFDYFREQNFKMDDLANKLNIPKSHLSYVFKYHSTISFSEFKKIIRIYDAINLIENGYLNYSTLDSLSKKTGFTSYNSFFTSFKEIIGLAPIEYINNMQTAV